MTRYLIFKLKNDIINRYTNIKLMTGLRENLSAQEKPESQMTDAEKTDMLQWIRDEVKGDLSPAKEKIDYLQHHLNNAIDYFWSNQNDTGKKKRAIRKFERVIEHCITEGPMGKEKIMLNLIYGAANGLIKEGNLANYAKYANYWPEIKFIIKHVESDEIGDLKKIADEYTLKNIGDFKKYYQENISIPKYTEATLQDHEKKDFWKKLSRWGK